MIDPKQQRRTDRVSRPVAASPDRIYAALVDPDALIQWLPPRGMRGRVLLHEPYVGGRYRIELTYEESGHGKTSANTDMTEGVFVEVDPGRRLVQTVHFHSEDPAFAGEMRLGWNLIPDGGGTRVEMFAEQVPPGISAEDHQTGLTSSLDNLAAFLA